MGIFSAKLFPCNPWCINHWKTILTSAELLNWQTTPDWLLLYLSTKDKHHSAGNAAVRVGWIVSRCGDGGGEIPRRGTEESLGKEHAVYLYASTCCVLLLCYQWCVCYPVSGGLGRSMVRRGIGRTTTIEGTTFRGVIGDQFQGWHRHGNTKTINTINV